MKRPRPVLLQGRKKLKSKPEPKPRAPDKPKSTQKKPKSK